MELAPATRKAIITALVVAAAAWALAACSITAPQPPASAAFLGDSIIFRLGALSQWFGPQAAQWTNAGIGSNSVRQMRARLTRDVPANAAFCVLYGGINDFWVDKSTPADVAALYGAIADTLESMGIRPVFTTVLPLGIDYLPYIDPPALNAKGRELNAMIRQLAARRGIPLADLSPLFDRGDGFGRDSLLDVDHGHLNDAGKRVLAAAVTGTLSRSGILP